MTGGADADTFAYQAGDLFDLMAGAPMGVPPVDEITDFSSDIDADGVPAEAGVNDALDFADLLGSLGYAGDPLTDWLMLDSDGTDSTVLLDQDGAGAGAGFEAVVTLTGFDGTGLGIQDLVDNDQLFF
jgi:hypothetical protein